MCVCGGGVDMQVQEACARAQLRLCRPHSTGVSADYLGVHMAV